MSRVSNSPVGKMNWLPSGHGVGASVKGIERERNEDCFVVDPDGEFFIVADGIGGVSGGEVASSIACEVLKRELRHLVQQHSSDEYADSELKLAEDREQGIKAELLCALKLANDAILSERQDSCCYNVMGCTVVAAVIIGDQLYLANMGDSRAYQLRGNEIEQLTRDHIMTAEMVDTGLLTLEQAATHPYRNSLYKYLGGWSDSDPADVQVITLRRGDCFVFATDGITDCVAIDEIASVCANSLEAKHAAAEMIGTAIENGASDDMTCVVLYIAEHSQGAPILC